MAFDCQGTRYGAFTIDNCILVDYTKITVLSRKNRYKINKNERTYTG